MTDLAWYVTLLISGVYLSAFFSGTETGFYRISRIRLALDAQFGDQRSRQLNWLVSHPSLFVATTLVGNNVANYLTSFSMVYLSHGLSVGHPELIATIVLTPLVFVFGELLPKNLHFSSPGHLLRQRTLALWLATILFAPLNIPLALFTRLLSRLIESSEEPVEMLLGKRRLEQLFREGHEEGILTQTQRQLIQGILSVAQHYVGNELTPMGRQVYVSEAMDASSVIRLSRRQRVNFFPVQAKKAPYAWLGYIRVSDLMAPGTNVRSQLRPFTRVASTENSLQVLIQIYRDGSELALVEDDGGKPVGVVNKQQLEESLFHTPV